MSEIKVKEGFSLISILNQDSVEAVNSYLQNSGHKIRYSKGKSNNNIKIIREYKKFKFWDKLVRERKAVDL